MSSLKQTGEISLDDDHRVEWTIKDFFSYTMEDEYHNSPRFSVSGSKWYLRISPNGLTEYNSVGWISMFLHRDYTAPPVGANFTFGVKKVDGTIEALGDDVSWLFEDDDGRIGYPKTLKRSELLRRKSELAPSDDLTLTCTLRVNKCLDSYAKLDTLSKDLVDMFVSKRGCDATLKVKQERFLVHKCILAARSPVFAAMFEVEMKEKNTGVVDIPDCHPGAFRDFLTYLYSGKADSLSSNAFELFKIADKYDVKELMSACLISMMGSLSLENVCDAILLSHQFDEETLKYKTQKFFNKNFSEIVSSAKWESLLKENYVLANSLLKNMAPKIKLED